jgi:hypothetical protein
MLQTITPSNSAEVIRAAGVIDANRSRICSKV